MSTPNSATAYFQSTGVGASAVGQVIALYDTIIRDLRRAMDAVKTNQVEKRVNASNHALIVIGELQGVLDFERGGAAAHTLNSFYTVTRPMISQASIGGSLPQFQEVLDMFMRIRAAWAKVENSVAPAQPTDRLRVTSSSTPAMAQPTVSAQRFAPKSADGNEELAGSGRGSWSA